MTSVEAVAFAVNIAKISFDRVDAICDIHLIVNCPPVGLK
jgi:hypothetical protein